ncbi:hypothetical protein NC651_016124 [Populus alba x Populus x berolinensis]|nr:hypothetical protein NC651_016124 [Populus alba x Populus x berolinensis]
MDILIAITQTNMKHMLAYLSIC